MPGAAVTAVGFRRDWRPGCIRWQGAFPAERPRSLFWAFGRINADSALLQPAGLPDLAAHGLAKQESPLRPSGLDFCRANPCRWI